MYKKTLDFDVVITASTKKELDRFATEAQTIIDFIHYLVVKDCKRCDGTGQLTTGWCERPASNCCGGCFTSEPCRCVEDSDLMADLEMYFSCKR